MAGLEGGAGGAGEAARPWGAGPSGRLVLRWLVVLVALSVLGSMAGFLWNERHKQIEAASDVGARRAAQLADLLQDTLAVTQVALNLLESKLSALPPGAALDDGLRKSMADIGPLLAHLPLSVAVQAVGADGRLLARTSLPGNVADAALVLPEGTRWRAAPASGPEGRRGVPFLRRAAAGGHAVAAWLVVLDHAALVNHFDDSRVHDGGGAALFRAEPDGSLVVLTRAPHNEADLGLSVRGPMAAALQRAPRGTFVAATQIDQVERVVAYQRLGGDAADLVVGHGMATEALLAPWRGLLPWAAAATLLLLGALLAVARWLDRALSAQVQQQQALQRSENHFRALADNLPDVVVRLDREGRHLYTNPAVLRATGLPPEAFIGKTNADLGMPAENVAVWMATLRKVFDQGRAERLEFAFPGPTGPRHWESVIAPEPVSSGEPATALVISRDITERKQAEAAREALSRRMVDVLDTMSDGFISVDRQWRFEAVNRKAGEMLGRDAAGLIGKAVWTEFPEAEGQPFHRAYQRAMDEGLPAVLEAYFAPWDKWFENRIHPSVDGISIFFTEITERVRSADALRDSERRHREMFESNPHPMWVYDSETLAFLAVNDAAIRQYGYSREQFLGMTIKDIRPPEDLPRLLEKMAHRSPDFEASGDWRHCTKDGRVLEVEITSHSMLFEGRPAKLVMAHDVTRRNQAERTLRESEERLRLALQAANQGLYDLDLRTGDAVVSPEYARMLGWEPEAFHETNALWRERLHPDDQAGVTRVYEDYVAGRRSDYRVECRQRTKDGGWKWILSIGRIQEHDAQGRPLRMLGTHTDITAIKHAQVALAQSEARYRDLFENSPVPMLVHEGGALRLLAVNAAFLQQYGYSRDQALALRLTDLHPEQDRQAIAELASKASGLTHAGEWQHLRRDGTVLTIEAYSHDIDMDGRPARIVVLTDITERRRAEAGRRAAAERFEKLFQAAPEAISLSELETGRFLQVNGAFCGLFGHPVEAVIGRTSAELNLWTQGAGRDAIVKQLRAGRPVHGFEGLARHHSGELIDVQFSAERVEFDGTECLLLMFRDVSQRKRLESEARASQGRLTYLLGRAPTVIYTARAGGDYAATYYSPNIAGMLGWQPAQFLQDGAFWLDHVHPDDRSGVLARLDELQTRDGLVLEYRFQHADGRWRWMRDQVGVERDAEGKPAELVGSWIDITERREAEDQVRHLAAELEQRVIERTEQLARSEARYRTIFETVPVSIGEEDWSGVQQLLRDLRARGVTDGPGYFATRPDFVRQCMQAVKVQRLNHKALVLHDAQGQRGDIAGLEAFYSRPEDLSQFVGEIEAMWSGRPLFTAKRSLVSVQGRPLSLMLTMSLPALDAVDGMALVCLVDITEIDRLNAELDLSVARLRHVNQELETFTYSVSHDLKAPLRGIDGYSRLLLTDHREQLDAEGREFLDHIRQATRHMAALIDDLLSYSHLERRGLMLARQPLAQLVDGVLAGFRKDFGTAGVQLEVRIDPGLHAQADAHGLTIALRNLIDNALKFSRSSVPPRITIEAERAGDGVRLSVQDNGVGFDMKFHDRIFSIFQRLHRAEEYPGTGIGLAIARKAMERMGGRVWARSQPGQGACFTLLLPEAESP